MLVNRLYDISMYRLYLYNDTMYIIYLCTIHVHPFLHKYTCVYTYIYIYIHIYIYIYIYIRIYIYTHTHTHVHTLPTAWYYIFCCTSLPRCLHADRPETIVADDRFSQKITLKQNSKSGARSVEIRFHHYPFCSLIIWIMQLCEGIQSFL